MDSFINKLDKNQREEVDNLSEEERIGLDVLFKTTVGVISKSIKDINFSDFEYVAGYNTTINLPEEVIELQDSTSVSYNEAMNIFRNSIVGEEKQSKIFNDIFLNLIDIYMVETVKKYDNDFDRFVVIQRAIASADNIASHATYIESFEFPQFAGPTMPKFAGYYSDDATCKKKLFDKITTNMKSNAEFNRMKVEDVIGNIKQDGQKFTQQLDFTIKSIKDISETMVTNVMDTKNLDPEEKPCENGICLKNLNSIMEKWQEIFEKIKDSKDIDKNFKEKLNDSLSI